MKHMSTIALASLAFGAAAGTPATDCYRTVTNYELSAERMFVEAGRRACEGNDLNQLATVVIIRLDAQATRVNRSLERQGGIAICDPDLRVRVNVGDAVLESPLPILPHLRDETLSLIAAAARDCDGAPSAP